MSIYARDLIPETLNLSTAADISTHTKISLFMVIYIYVCHMSHIIWHMLWFPSNKYITLNPFCVNDNSWIDKKYFKKTWRFSIYLQIRENHQSNKTQSFVFYHVKQILFYTFWKSVTSQTDWKGLIYNTTKQTIKLYSYQTTKLSSFLLNRCI